MKTLNTFEATMVRMYVDDRMTLAEVGETMGFSYGKARYLLLQYGVTLRKGHRKCFSRLAMRNERIFSDRAKGETQAALGRKYNLGRASIRRILKAAGGDPCQRDLKRKCTSDQVDQFVRQYESGMTAQQIADLSSVDISMCGVRKNLIRRGVQMRVPGSRPNGR